ncbi:MAG: acylphosphatase [Gammaproteobacteria bacterium]|nr:acylphosphatase [Gammaproteobacteria bacterium]MDH5735650.1 acylphosphatase [Gammaproteobacteria bacterium]
MMLCRHYCVSGKVQGVFYRASAHDRAVQLGITGWVKNMLDGRVEAVACGSEQQLAEFENWLRQGPPLAVVDKLEINYQVDNPGSAGFEIRYR